MRGVKLELEPVIPADELRDGLETILSQSLAHAVRVTVMERRVSEYCSSFMLEELDVTLDDGTSLALLLKDLSPGSLFGGAVKVKPSFIYDPLREIETYRRILSRHDIGAPRCHGAITEPERNRYWLLLERVAPELLWQQGELDAWTRMAAWLAGMHGIFQKSVDYDYAAHLLHYDSEFYWRWMRRAKEFVSDGDNTKTRDAAKAMDWLETRYERVVERLCALPVTVIHGEFFASNILLDTKSGRVCPVDWELAAVGPGLIDLAAMSAGNWTRDQKDAMALAYHAAMPKAGLPQPNRDEFLKDVECARLHQAVHWLGWSPGWTPPPEHAQNWLHEALDSARRLKL